jgi:hypothetical protein
MFATFPQPLTSASFRQMLLPASFPSRDPIQFLLRGSGLLQPQPEERPRIRRREQHAPFIRDQHGRSGEG